MIAKGRRRKGWPQRDLAAMIEKSESWVSQVERDVIPVNSLETLRHISDVLGIPLPELLGAAPPPGQPSASARRPSSSASASARVGRNLGPEEADDPVRRRELLAAAAVVFASPLTTATPAEASTLAPLEDLLLYGTARVPEGSDVSPVGVAAAVRESRAHFRAARYDLLARVLPGQIAQAQALRPAELSATAVADLYNIAARLCIKLGEDGLVAITADRALNSARRGGDALTIAEAHRMVSSAWRRQGHLARATDIAVRAAQDVQADRSTPESARLAAGSSLLATAAYTAAKMGDRQTARALIGEATETARAGSAAAEARTDTGVQQVRLHQLSVHYLLGDAGQAIDLARTIDPSALPTPERQGRFFIDVARCFDQWGKPAQCYRALLAAEQAAPQEIRRGAVKDLAGSLLRHDRSLPGVRTFAARAGVPVN
ncbi:helix-turn-helix domain-containing protein [Streptomyces sp. NRRL F-4489]|uniref:helix-turn-helix domain-containing protein n=1 Tax=Streptomyces sp. NRRL F-4489 TaxID=1609095 RepID=UPI00131CF1E5|nr:helix-turn-helix transcriptional regulator [Streptomyces sp. NRRL F-4489]